MKFTIACFVSMLFFLQFGIAQDVDWQTAQNWKLFKVPVRTGFSIPIDSLTSFRGIKLDIDKMKAFLTGARPIPTESYAWMGVYVGSYELKDHKRRKILFSSYGGFFYDETTDRYFQIAENMRYEWHRFLKETNKRIK